MSTGRRIGVVLGLAALVAAACGDGNSGATTTTTIAPIVLTTTTQPVPETTTSAAATTTAPVEPLSTEIVIGMDDPINTLNPFAPGGDFIGTTIAAQLHLAGVWDIDGQTRTFIPEVVTDLPTLEGGSVVLNADGTMTVRYEIRDEATWSDGVPISGEDFQFTLDTILAIGATEGSTLDTTGYDRVVATMPGPKTFEMTLAESSAGYQRMFRHLIPQHAVEGTDVIADWPAAEWPAAGPFVLQSFAPGQAATFVRNDAYWKVDESTGEPLPGFDRATLLFVPETERLVGQLINGEIDIMRPPPFQDLVDTFAAVGNIEVQDVAGQIWEHFNFQFGPNNRNDSSFNASLAFRQAIAYGTDRSVLASVAGWGEPITTMRSASGPPAGDGAWGTYGYDPEIARALVATACVDLGRDCEAQRPTIVYSTTSNAEARPAVAEALVPMLDAIGVDVELELEDSQLFFGPTLDDGTWDVAEWAWVDTVGMAGGLVLLETFDPDAPPPDGNNFYRWGTPDTVLADTQDFDAMRDILQQARAAVDPAEFDAIFSSGETLLADNAVIIPIAARRYLLAARTDKVVGYVANPTDAGFTWNIEFWHAP